MLYHENTLIATQCSFFTGVYLMMTMRILAAWKSFVQAATQCLSYLLSQGKFGDAEEAHYAYLARLEGDEECLSEQEPQVTEESLYWSCLKSEL